MSTDSPVVITIGDNAFEVSAGFLETLDELAFLIHAHSRAEVIQQAVALLYLLGRERHEKRVQTFMHYPDGAMKMLQFWKNAQPLHDVNRAQPSIAQSSDALDPEFERYREAMPAYKKQIPLTKLGEAAND